MNLLLLLSALLTALTGLAGGARTTEQAAVVRPLATEAAHPATRAILARRAPSPSSVRRDREEGRLPSGWTLAVVVLDRTLRRRE